MFKCPECGYLGFEEEKKCPKCGTDVTHLNAGEETNAILQPPPEVEKLEPPTEEPRSNLIETPEHIIDLEKEALEQKEEPIIAKHEEPKRLEEVIPEQKHTVPDSPTSKPLMEEKRREFKITPRVLQQELPISHKKRDTQEELPFHPQILTRAIAFLIDSLLITGITSLFLLTPLLFGAGNFISFREFLGIFLLPFYLLFVLFHILYHTYFLTLTGQTPGKSVFNLKVVSRGGLSLEWHEALLRALGYLLSLIPAGMGFFWALFDKKKEALHDKLTGSRVISLGS